MNTESRAQLFFALGDPVRLAIIEDLLISDQSPHVLADKYELGTNLLTHHLGVLDDAGLITRSTSSGDARRRYVRLRHERLQDMELGAQVPNRPVLFVCTHNSARSQVAAALWEQTGISPAKSAGTEPAGQVHPGAVAAASRAGLDLRGRRPHQLEDTDYRGATVITVCDQAHEQIEDLIPHWHWSTPDPVANPSRRAFDHALTELRNRIDNLSGASNE